MSWQTAYLKDGRSNGTSGTGPCQTGLPTSCRSSSSPPPVRTLPWLVAMLGMLVMTWPATAQQARPVIVVDSISSHVRVVHMRQPDGTLIGASMVLFADAGQGLLVDANLPVDPLTALVRGVISDQGVTQLHGVVITHWHPDHSGGIAGFTARTKVFAHSNVRSRLSVATEGVDLVRPGSRFTAPARPAEGLPTELVRDSLRIPVGTAEAVTVHYPRSHTDGDLVIYFPTDNVVAVGDLYWPKQFPSVDIVNGGSPVGVLEALNDVLRRTDGFTRYVSGHGGVTDRSELETYAHMLEATISQIHSRRDAGETLEQIQAAGLDGDWSGWSSKLVPESQWIKLVYQARK